MVRRWTSGGKAEARALLAPTPPRWPMHCASHALRHGLRARGVRIAVVTSSPAATELVANHGGYAKLRRMRLETDLDLFEL